MKKREKNKKKKEKGKNVKDNFAHLKNFYLVNTQEKGKCKNREKKKLRQ